MRTISELIDEARAPSEALRLAIDAAAGTPNDSDDWVLDAEALAVKCLLHAQSCLLLARGTPVLATSSVATDFSSIDTLARAALESALVFHHVFASPNTPDEKELRHLVWIYTDLLARQHFSASSPESIKTQEHERQQLVRTAARLNANPCFQAWSGGQRRQLLQKGRGWNPGWPVMARNAGLDETHATQVYSYLCSHAHSGALAVLQLRTSRTQRDTTFLIAPSLGFAKIAMALTTSAYCSIFPKAASAVEARPELAQAVELWMHVGGGGPEVQ